MGKFIQISTVIALAIAFIAGSATASADANTTAQNIKNTLVRAYITRHQGQLYVASNVYAIAADESILMEDHSIKDRMLLRGDELFINFPEQQQQISLGNIQGLTQIQEGKRLFAHTGERLQVKLLSLTTKRTLQFIECRADIFCGPTLRINKQQVALYQARNFQGEFFCINHGHFKNRPSLFAGPCQR